jgi:hypothetical protein
MQALQQFLDAQPDSASHGHLFTAFRDENMGEGITSIRQSRSGELSISDSPRKTVDDVVEVTEDLGRDGPAAGRYAVEDKAGPNAFKPEQAQYYSDQLTEGGGQITTVDGSAYDGILYFFDTEAAATTAARSLEGLNPNIHVGFYNTMGELEWLR